jgi:hypothetical protein
LDELGKLPTFLEFAVFGKRASGLAHHPDWWSVGWLAGAGTQKAFAVRGGKFVCIHRAGLWHTGESRSIPKGGEGIKILWLILPKLKLVDIIAFSP